MKPRSKAHISCFALVTALLLMTPNLARAGECAKRSVAECADLLTEKFAALRKEHDALRQKLEQDKTELNQKLDRALSTLRRVEIGRLGANQGDNFVRFREPFKRPPCVMFSIQGFTGTVRTTDAQYWIDMKNSAPTIDGFTITYGPSAATPSSVAWVAVEKAVDQESC